MIKLPLSLIAALLTGCATLSPVPAGKVESDSVDSGAMSVGRVATARKIDGILFSDRTQAQMLRELRPYVKIGMTIDQFEKKTGLSRGMGIGSGPPGTMDYLNLECGLILGVGPSRKIRIIRRSEKTIHGKKFDSRSISAPGYSDSGYGRWYPN